MSTTEPIGTKKERVSSSYIRQVAKKNGVRISKDAKSAYTALPNKAAADDMITHAAKLAKALKKKTISVEMAKVEMQHYTQEKK